MMKRFLLLILLFSAGLNGCTFRKINDLVRVMQEQITNQQRQISGLRGEVNTVCQKGEMDEESCQSYGRAIDKMYLQIYEWRRQMIRMDAERSVAVIPQLSKDAASFVEDFRIKHERYNNLIAAIQAIVRDESKMRPFETAAYFPSGKYEIPPETIPAMTNALRPTLTGVTNFRYRFPDFPCQPKIEVDGYADRTPIREGTNLYDTLKLGLGVQQPTRAQLNQQLSKWRAENVVALFAPIPESKGINLLGVGKGEEDPPGANLLPAHQKLRDDDERRRIVVVYWGCPINAELN